MDANSTCPIECCWIKVAVGDFNNDGNQDFVSVSFDYGSVKVFYGFGNTTFTIAYDYSDSYKKQYIVVDDFNGDTKLDFAVALYELNTITLYLANDAGGFNVTEGFQTGISPYAMTTGNFNNDTNADLAVVNFGNSSISILLGRADGTFAATSYFSVGDSPTSIATGRFDDDNYLDLVVTNSGDHTISVLLGNGDGTFKTPDTFPASYDQPRAVAVADMNQDGIADIVVSYLNNGDSKLDVLLGESNGSFYLSTKFYSTDYAPTVLGIADFNGDLRNDVVVVNSDSSLFSIFLNIGP